jgi:hypothetical protein
MFTDDEMNRFRESYLLHHGTLLSEEEALAIATSLIECFKAIAKPFVRPYTMEEN